MNSADPETALEPFTDLDTTVLDAFDAASSHLRGTRCADCDRVVFPSAQVCFRCHGTNVQPADIAQTGVLYTYTWVHPGHEAEPYALGYVDLEEDVRVLARLRGDRNRFACGTPVRLLIADGTWWFTSANDAVLHHEGAQQ